MTHEQRLNDRLNPEQQTLLRINSVEAIQNGLARRYAAVRQGAIDYFTHEIEKNPDSPLVAIFEAEIKAAHLSLSAEIPFCFVQNPGEDRFGFGVAKVYVNSGELITSSTITFGVKIHDKEEPEVVGPGFTQDDASFSLDSIAAQTACGMDFHYIDGLR